MPSLPFHSGLSCVLFHNLLLAVLDYKSLVVLAYLLTCDVVDVSLSVSLVAFDAVDACRGFFVGELDGKALMVILVWCKVIIFVIVLNLEVAVQNVCRSVAQTDSGSCNTDDVRISDGRCEALLVTACSYVRCVHSMLLCAFRAVGCSNPALQV